MATDSSQHTLGPPLGTSKAPQKFLSTARIPRRKVPSLPKAYASECAPSAVLEHPKLRIIHSFRDQEPAKGRLHEVGSVAPSVLASKQHSLFGYPADLTTRFDRVDEELGEGGNASVRKIRCKLTGKEYACKSVKKVLTGDKWSDAKKRGHVDALRREIEVLRSLRGSLNIATLEDVYEDDAEVHIILELCKGGELVHRIGSKHYSERTVASYMRAVLRTIAQCHSQRVLHRDIKPGNFLLLNDDEMAPLKAIDFGLATPFKPEELPRADLGLEGTPWFMAPEVLSSQVGPPSDVWSAGVMAHQLLTGRLPFDDKRNPLQPSVTKIWQSILCDKVDFKRSFWADISDSAKDFVTQLLEKDPAKRLTAREALRHPWLRGDAGERSTGKQISLNVVQRIQRFGHHSILKRTVLEHIAEDMLRQSQVTPASEGSCPLTSGSKPIVIGPTASPLQYLYNTVRFGTADRVSREQVLCTLQGMGYRLDQRETAALMDMVDSGHTGSVGKIQLAASQIDWQALQQRNVESWLEAARRTFKDLDADGDGIWSCDEIVRCLSEKLGPSEVDAALQQAMKEACKREESVHEGIDFDAFLTMLRVNSCDSLDQYDDRMGSSAERLSLLVDLSCRAGDLYSSSAKLEPVAEVL